MFSEFVNHSKNRMAPELRGALYYWLFWLADATFDPFLNVHFNRLGLSGIEIGWLSMFTPLFILIIPSWVSRFADKFSMRVRLLTILTVAVAITITFYAFPQTFVQFLPWSFLVSILRSSVSPLADSLIARMASKYQINFGDMRFWGSLAFFITSICLGYLWSRVGFNYMFIAAGLLFIPTAASAALLEETAPEVNKNSEQTSMLAGFTTFIQDKSLILLGLASFLGVGAMSMSNNFIGIFMQSLGGNETYIGALWGFSALFEIPTMIFSPRIVRRIGDTNTIMLSYVLIGMGFFGYSLSHTPFLLVVFACMRGLGFGLMFVNIVTIIDRRAPAHLSTTFQGIIASLSWGLAPLLASPMSGFIFDQWGAVPLFVLCGSFCLAAVLLMIPTYFYWGKPTH